MGKAKAKASPAAAPAAEVKISPAGEWSDPGTRKRLGEEFLAGAPYPHVTIRPFLGKEQLQKLRAELEVMNATEKETDLFRFFQTADLARMEEEAGAAGKPKVVKRRKGPAAKQAGMPPALAGLSKMFASAEFKELCTDVTQCGELADRIDLAAQIYTCGAHLLCHDDVIGTRKVTFIYYLTDPDEEWASAEGGTLELYPVDPKAPRGTPAVCPSKELLPLSDSLVLFLVEPGVSFHSVREVRGGRARMALQGWLHAPELSLTRSFENRDLATLGQLLATRNGTAAAAAPHAEAEAAGASREEDGPAAVLAPEDAAALARWIAPEYLDPKQVEAVAERFAEESYVVLTSFLRADLAGGLVAALDAADDACGICMYVCVYIYIYIYIF